ncbi:unnamed protein product [Pleuronectes platessa]|uniref:Uncharacterized protein n=1 Tax=Pleuronectes platessa TaxID=8262 RepID=A0A9N7Z6E8_PLEPL|nr:unnamed protein product [Pleuronectes platessa]
MEEAEVLQGRHSSDRRGSANAQSVAPLVTLLRFILRLTGLSGIRDPGGKPGLYGQTTITDFTCGRLLCHRENPAPSQKCPGGERGKQFQGSQGCLALCFRAVMLERRRVETRRVETTLGI